MSCLSIFSASAFGIISFVTKAEKEICASAKAAIVDPAACSGLLKSSSSVIEQLPCRLVFALLGKSEASSVTSEMCHKATYQCKKVAALFDHLVGEQQKRLRDFQIQCLGCLEVDHQFESGWNLDRQVGRACALENLVHHCGRLPV